MIFELVELVGKGWIEIIGKLGFVLIFFFVWVMVGFIILNIVFRFWLVLFLVVFFKYILWFMEKVK